jgi:hypothetical protein
MLKMQHLRTDALGDLPRRSLESVPRDRSRRSDADRALEYLAKAYQERCLDIAWQLKADHRVDSLRTDPRFQTLLRNVNSREQRSPLTELAEQPRTRHLPITHDGLW